MLKTVARNRFGGYTWRIKLNSEYHILIHETNESTLIVECKEAFYIKYKTVLSFVSNEPMLQTIEMAFDKFNIFLVETKKIYWPYLAEKKFETREEYLRIESKLSNQ